MNGAAGGTNCSADAEFTLLGFEPELEHRDEAADCDDGGDEAQAEQHAREPAQRALFRIEAFRDRGAAATERAELRDRVAGKHAIACRHLECADRMLQDAHVHGQRRLQLAAKSPRGIVRHDTDDREVPIAQQWQSDAPSHRVTIRVHLLRETRAHHGYEWRIPAIAIGEQSSGQQGDATDGERVSTDGVMRGGFRAVTCRHPSQKAVAAVGGDECGGAEAAMRTARSKADERVRTSRMFRRQKGCEALRTLESIGVTAPCILQHHRRSDRVTGFGGRITRQTLQRHAPGEHDECGSELECGDDECQRTPVVIDEARGAQCSNQQQGCHHHDCRHAERRRTGHCDIRTGNTAGPGRTHDQRCTEDENHAEHQCDTGQRSGFECQCAEQVAP